MAITEKNPIVLTIKDLCASKAEFFQRAQKEAVMLMSSAEFKAWQLKRPSGVSAGSLASSDGLVFRSPTGTFSEVRGLEIAVDTEKILDLSKKDKETAQSLQATLIAHELREGWVLVKPGFNLKRQPYLAHNLGVQAEYDLAARLGILGISLEIDQGYINAYHRKGIFSEMTAYNELYSRIIAAGKARRRMG